MAIAFGASGGFSGGSGTTITTSKPTGVSNGNLILMFIHVSADQTITTPSGWTLVETATNGSGTTHSHVKVFSRIASSEPSTTAVTVSGSNLLGHGCQVSFTGTSLLVDAHANNNAGSSTTATAPAITPTQTPSYVVGFFGVRSQSSTDPTQTTAAGYTEAAKSTFYELGGHIVYKSYSGTSSTGTYSQTVAPSCVSSNITLDIYELNPNATVSPPLVGTVTAAPLAPSVSTTGSTNPSVDAVKTVTFAKQDPTVVAEKFVTIAPPLIGTVTFAAPSISLLKSATLSIPTVYLFWEFDQVNGGVVQLLDSSPNNRTGESESATAITGVDGTGASTNGTSTYIVDQLSATNFPSTSGAAYSVELWVKDISATGYLLGSDTNSSTNTTGFIHWNASTKRLSAGSTRPAVPGYDPRGALNKGVWNFTSVYDLNDGIWHQIVITKPDSGSSDPVRVYFDGANISALKTSTGTGIGTGGSDDRWRNGAPMRLMSDRYDNVFTPGKVDNFVLYTSALSDVEVGHSWALGPSAVSVTVSAPTAKVVTFAPQNPTVTTGFTLTVSPPIMGTVTNAMLAPNVSAGGSLSIGVTTPTTTYAAKDPTVTTNRTITIVMAEPPPVTLAAAAPTVYTTANQFIFIDASSIAFTALDAEEIDSLDIGTLSHTQSRKKRFRLGNTAAVPCSFIITVISANADVPDMVQLSTDNSTYSDTVTIVGVQPNAISPVVWVNFTVAESAFTSAGSFIINVEQTNA